MIVNMKEYNKKNNNKKVRTTVITLLLRDISSDACTIDWMTLLDDAIKKICEIIQNYILQCKKLHQQEAIQRLLSLRNIIC